MYCKKCGTRIPEGADFCPGCQAPLGQNTTQEMPQKPAPERKPRWLIAAAIAVVVLGAAIAIWAAMQQNQHADDGNTNDSGEAPVIVISKIETDPIDPEPDLESEAPLCIELNWEPIYEDGNEYILDIRLDGRLDDGTSIDTPQSSQELTGPDGELLLRVVREMGHMVIELYRTDGRLDLEVTGEFETLGPLSGNGLVSSCGLTASVSGSDSGYFTTDKGMQRSYTNAWFWGPFGIDHGQLCEYDTQWLEDGYAHLDSDSVGSEDGAEEPSADENSQEEEAQSISLEDRISFIREVYYDTEANLGTYESYLTSDLISSYFDGDILKKISAQPGAYAGDEACPPGNYTASYYYDDDLTLLFVFVKDGSEEHRYYLDKTTCYRYIDSDGVTHDYPDGIAYTDLDGPSFFCHMGYMEPHWMNLI